MSKQYPEAVKKYRSSAKAQATYATWYANNRERLKAKAKAWKIANPDKVITYRRKHTRLLSGVVNPTGETRVGPCEICARVKKLYYDHDHSTGVFRGWLCNSCNMRLGWFEKLGDKFAQYLAKTRRNFVTDN